MTKIEINIDKYAQNKLTHSQIMDWFDEFDSNRQKEIRDKLSLFIKQTHPTEDLIKDAIKSAPIKESMTPVVLSKTLTLKNAIYKIEKLPDSELRKSFIIMLTIFIMADTYCRETIC